jgi:hypothetical protein
MINIYHTAQPLRILSLKEALSELQLLIQFENARNAFELFMRDQHAVELFRFYLDHDRFERIPASDHTHLVKEAHHLWEQYFTSGNPNELNLTEAIKEEIQGLMNKGRFAPNMFQKVKGEIFYCLQYDMLPRFKNTQHYRTLTQEINKQK